MKYAKIKQGTPAWELMNKIFTYHRVWGEHQQEISEFLGFPMDGNIAFQVSNLWVAPKALREHRPEWLKEFKKSEHEITSAKANSKIKKEWVALCGKLGLETYTTRDFSFKFGLAFMGNIEFHNMEGEYLVAIDNDKFDFSTHDWAEIIDEPTFLRMRADFLDKQKSA